MLPLHWAFSIFIVLIPARDASGLSANTCPSAADTATDHLELHSSLLQRRRSRETILEDVAEDALGAQDPTSCTSFAGFGCVFAGSPAGACRTSGLGRGTIGQDFTRVATSGPADCAARCAAMPACQAFEASAVTGHCEIWVNAPQKTGLGDPWMCRVKHYCGSKAILEGFACLPGFEVGACRTDSMSTGIQGTDWVLVDSVSQQDCAVKCNLRGDCLAFETNVAGGRCELWLSLPVQTSLATEWLCRVKASSVLTTTTTTSTTVTTTATTRPKPESILVVGAQLIVGGRSIHLKGVNWSPVDRGGVIPSGLNFVGNVQADSRLMQAAHMNVVRTYEPLLDWSVLDRLWSRGIYVLNTVYGWGEDAAEAVLSRVRAVKDHPAVLMWVIGNEWNYNGFYTGLSREASMIRVGEAARHIKQVDAKRPVATVYGELPSADTVAALPEIDVWGINVYRGDDFGDLFTSWAARSQRPMFLGEYGADAWDSRTAMQNHPAQAHATMKLTRQIVANSAKMGGSCLGGLIFEFNDEWWKDSAGSPSTHEVGGTAPGYGPHPDSVFNEEWWGLVDIDRNPREAYYAYMNVSTP